MTQHEIPWLEPDPVAVVTAFYDGKAVVIEGYGGDSLVYGFTTLDSIKGRRYRIIPPAPQTYELEIAHRAYCIGKWISWDKDPCPGQWNHIIHAPINCLMIADDGWLISDADPREQAKPSSYLREKMTPSVPRQCDVHEALRVWVKNGTVCSPGGTPMKRGIYPTAHFIIEWIDIDKLWTVTEEPPCPTN